VVEAAVDELKVLIYDAEPRMNVYGKTSLGSSVAVHVAGAAAAPFAVFYSSGLGSFSVPGFTGSILLNPASAFELIAGSVPATGLAQAVAALPTTPAILGVTVHLQAVVLGASPGFTNLSTITVE